MQQRLPGTNADNLIHPAEKEISMLGWAVTFLVIALVAAALGFGGIAGTSAGIAQILFFIFIVLFVVALVARAVRGRPPM
jgi:uncharacterized membrane protein YtjA (UPF0391 family)